jgi:hypothetical protein
MFHTHIEPKGKITVLYLLSFSTADEKTEGSGPNDIVINEKHKHRKMSASYVMYEVRPQSSFPLGPQVANLILRETTACT